MRKDVRDVYKLPRNFCYVFPGFDYPLRVFVMFISMNVNLISFLFLIFLLMFVVFI